MGPKTGRITQPAAPISASPATPAEETRIRRFLEGLQARGRSPATITSYQCEWRKVACWSRDLNGEPFDLTRMVGREAVELRNHGVRYYAPASVNHCLAFLADYARWAASGGEMPPSQAEELAKAPRVRKQALAPRGLSRQELRRFLREVDLRAGVRDRAIVYLLLHSGLRLGEVARLEIDDLTLSERKGSLRVRSEWAKGDKERTIPVSLAARGALASYLSVRGHAPGRLFLGQRGPLGSNGIARVIGKYAGAAGIPLSPHRLRHCFSYRYLEHTVNDFVGLAAILGHSNLNTTMIYARKRPEDLEAAVEGLEF